MAQFKSYLIAVKTSDLKDANTDAKTVQVSLIGVFGKTEPYRLNHSSNTSCPKIDAKSDPIKEEQSEVLPAIPIRKNLFELDKWDAFKITTNDVGTLLRIRVLMTDTDGWNLERAVVIPYNHDGETLDLSMRRSFIVNRWFDSKDFDGLEDLEIDSEETLQAPVWQPSSSTKTAKTMVMRYENSAAKELITNFKFHYSIVQGVAIEESQTKETKTGHTRTHSWEVSVKQSGEVLGAKVESEQKYSGSDVCTREIAKSCSNKYGAMTTTSMIQEQEIPITLPPNSVGTLIVQVYQTAVTHQVNYGDYDMPVTVYDGTIDISFKLYPEILDEENAWKKASELAQEAGATLPG
jgi:hypothetical protein